MSKQIKGHKSRAGQGRLSPMGFKGKKHTEETKAKISEAQKARYATLLSEV